jgi:hypothetical protein
MLKIVVGQGNNKCEFGIHEALLTARSKFFAKAMGKGWKEAEEKVVKLPDDEQEIFALYASLVYSGTVPAFDETPERIIHENDGQTDCRYPDICQLEYESLVGLYVFAEKLQDVKAKNAAVDALIAKVTHESKVIFNTEYDGPCMPSLAAIETMYAKTPHHCPGRQVLIDCFVWYGKDQTMEYAGLLAGALPPWQFLIDLSSNLMSMRQQPKHDPPHEHICCYQEPEDDEDEWHMDPWFHGKRVMSPLRR